MPTMRRYNVLDNPAFRLWDYGTAAINLASLPSHGYFATRWKIANTGWTGNVSKGITSSDQAVPKWLRDAPCVQFAITSASGTSLVMRQTIEDAQSYARSFAVLTVYGFGPDGGSFAAGIEGQVKRVTTRGPDTLVRLDVPILLGDLAATIATVDVFRDPSGSGTYKVAFAQLTLGGSTGKADRLELPLISDDRRSCSRYAQPVGAGKPARAVSATRLVVALEVDPPMRASGSLVSPASSVTAVAMSNGATVTAAAATITYVSAGIGGGRFIIDGFTGLTTGDSYMITTAVAGVLHADY